MKQLILATLLVASALHAAADTTRISIQPSWPADCLKGDYDFINEMSEVEKVKETETEATFQFVTRIIRCESFARIPYALDVEKVQAAVGGTKIEYTLRGTSELVVTVKFDKNKVFKLNRPVSKQRQTHKTYFIFYPYGYTDIHPQYWENSPRPMGYSHRGNWFWWNVRLSRDQANTMDMKLVREENIP